ncbi:transglutaminase domain-containing protein [Hymenobacter sp. BT559]|uniref:transglutaminase domain-containing protein n=1 Tax=Hymenobacter sp. BT559 TaxID=2795729 RepID=UPI0018EC93C7|nr:transglutaminase domain-containing protein [Hymenobacter sp. BT559]MBJ6142375.1 hypothetical protein [Hymenobacter sp. BT559]
MRYIVIFMLWLTAHSVYAVDKVDSVRYAYAKKAPQNLALITLVNYLKRGAINNQKVVETFFYWIAWNIKYDKELMLKDNKSIEDISLDVVLSKKKTICSGYSNLLYEMCKAANIECVVIHGFAQTMIDEENGVPHAWNAVKINNKWYLVDVTWGSGGFGLGSDEYTVKLDMHYFLADPKFLLIDHFPNEAKWQLLPKPISLVEFHNKYWDEMRYRKFNNLLDDAVYKEHKNMEKESIILTN